MKEFISNFFKDKSKGFYVSLSAAAASLLTLIIYVLYATVGGGQMYFSALALIFVIVSVVAFCAMAIFKPTAAWAPFVQAVFFFIAFLAFIYGCYRYFSEVFYGGVTLNAIIRMNGLFTASLLLFFISTVLTQIGVHMKQIKTDKGGEENAKID